MPDIQIRIEVEVEVEAVPGEFAIHRLAAEACLPQALFSQPLYSVLHSQNETSVLCGVDFEIDAQATEAPYRCVRVTGQLDFSLVGVLRDLTATLASHAISVFVVSSFDTDYLFVREENYAQTLEILNAR
ncbi:MAG: ACT domain-containing protein [Proteobacteria bacterium]|nr:ACT domain-containing protein [Pseudomonadota bacterium]